MHRRHSRRLLLAIAAVLLVAACGGNSGEPTASSPEPIATATLTASSASPPAPTRLPPTVEMVAASAGLDASKLTLVVFYPISAPVWATLQGAPGAAANGAVITCRSTAADGRTIGSARASTVDGSFQMGLDASVFPSRIRDLSESGKARGKVECRAGDGHWVRPGETTVGME